MRLRRSAVCKEVGVGAQLAAPRFRIAACASADHGIDSSSVFLLTAAIALTAATDERAAAAGGPGKATT